jgi:methionyl-tRNA synthetase
MKPEITYDDFAKIDLRIATVLAAREHPNADKLMLLQIKVGEVEKQIVAGIRGHYTPEQLVGRQIVVVNNLQEAMLRGEESHGMLLAASDAGVSYCCGQTGSVSGGGGCRESVESESGAKNFPGRGDVLVLTISSSFIPGQDNLASPSSSWLGRWWGGCFGRQAGLPIATLQRRGSGMSFTPSPTRKFRARRSPTRPTRMPDHFVTPAGDFVTAGYFGDAGACAAFPQLLVQPPTPSICAWCREKPGKCPAAGLSNLAKDARDRGSAR